MAFCKGAVAWDDLADREGPVHRKPCLCLFVVPAWWFVAVGWCLLAALSLSLSLLCVLPMAFCKGARRKRFDFKKSVGGAG